VNGKNKKKNEKKIKQQVSDGQQNKKAEKNNLLF
jgi:hypothetical protein